MMRRAEFGVTLDELETINGPALALVAGFVGKTRLIDNESI